MITCYLAAETHVFGLIMLNLANGGGNPSCWLAGVAAPGIQICLAGGNVAEGYWHDPEGTRARLTVVERSDRWRIPDRVVVIAEK